MTEPLRVNIELMRLSDAEDPYAFQPGPQRYSWQPPDGRKAVFADLDWTPELLAQVAALAREEPGPEVLDALGRVLGDFLGQLGLRAQGESIRAALEEDGRVLLSVRSNAAELYALPWELATLTEEGVPLGARAGVLLRYAWPGTSAAAEPLVPRPEGGDLLFAWSEGGGAVPHALQLRTLEQLWERAVDPKVARLHALPATSLSGLLKRLQEAEAAKRPIRMLHLLCHGVQRGEVAGLLLGAPGEEEWVNAQELARGIEAFAGTLRLVVLCACQGGDAGRAGARLPGVAQALHRAGLQSVVASRFPLSKPGSVVMTGALWRALLLESGALEDAVLAARRALMTERKGLEWATLQLYARAEDGQDTRPFTFRPYRGLLPYREAHQSFFFGRRQEIGELLADLNALRKSGAPRFVVVAGASGTGKSSLVLSGMTAALATRFELVGSSDGGEAKEHTSEQLREMKSRLDQLADGLPGDIVREVRSGLVRALALLEGTGHGWKLVTMRPGASPLRALNEALSRRPEGGALVLVVDQLEEIFQGGVEPHEQREFGRRLWALAQDARCSYVICTIRVDDLGHCSELVLDDAGTRLDQVAYDEHHRVFVAQMTRDQLEQVIVQPARRVGLRIDENLVKDILDELQDLPNSLPLLAHTLDLLWRRREGGALTRQAYREIDGVGGALHFQADRLLAELDDAQRQVARRVFVRLVAADGQHRQRALLATLRPVEPELEARFDGVVERLEGARLVYRGEQEGEPTLEVAHEALIRRWGMLRRWLREDQGMLAQLEEMEGWAEQYAEHGTLLDGQPLSLAQAVASRFPGQLSAKAQEMLRESQRIARRNRATRVGVVATMGGLSVSLGLAISLGWWASVADAVRAQDTILISEAGTRIARASEADLWPLGASTGGERERAAAMLLDVGVPERARGWDTLATALLAPTLRQHRFAAAPAEACVEGACAPEVEACEGLSGAEITASAFHPRGGALVLGDTTGAVMLAGLTQEDSCVRQVLEPAFGRAVTALAFTDGERKLAVVRGDELVFIDLTEKASSPSRVQLPGAGTRWLAAGSGKEPLSLVVEDGGPRLLRCSPEGCEPLGPEPAEGRWEVLDLDGRGERLLLRGPDCAPDSAPAPCASEAVVEVRSATGARRLPLEPGEVPLHGALGPDDAVVLALEPERIEGDIEAPMVIAKMLLTGQRSSVLFVEDERDPYSVYSHLLDAVAEEVVFSPDGQRFAERGADGVLRVRGLGEVRHVKPPSPSPDILERRHGLRGAAQGSVVFSRDGARVAALFPGASEGEVLLRVWESAAPDSGGLLGDFTAATPAPPFAIRLTDAPLSAYTQLTLSPKGQWVGLVREGQELWVFELSERPPREALLSKPPACLDLTTYEALGTANYRGLARRCACLEGTQGASTERLVAEGCESWTASLGRAVDLVRTWQLGD
ncbi:MAG: CHAT domain-containing protein [Alphaproteobacteria bacterium]|nr:CHAT domain-containing protein [Alphaproteobacteria bacterium]MCB9794448.1 CHAT domain-containing protein [Alphaproteobacteria bacterium]